MTRTLKEIAQQLAVELGDQQPNLLVLIAVREDAAGRGSLVVDAAAVSSDRGLSEVGERRLSEMSERIRVGILDIGEDMAGIAGVSLEIGRRS